MQIENRINHHFYTTFENGLGQRRSGAECGRVALFNLEAVPEPSVYNLIGASAFFAFIVCKYVFKRKVE
ncbi:MAG TPA: hypothetical protein VIK59_03160 [Verrucomicrobiae bacterium]